jgi:chemotaxis protein histidine kinase CheA
VKDDGQGLNLERIGPLALNRDFYQVNQLATISNNHLFWNLFSSQDFPTAKPG